MNKFLPSSPESLPSELSFLYFSQSQSLPGISGRARQEPEDFVVEEEALYQPSGEGEHCYLWVQKQGISTRGAIRKLSRLYGKRDKDFGYAGLKDAAGITRQYLSFVHTGPLPELEKDLSTKIQILSIARHKNKLRPGHLKGNHFQLRLQGCASGDLERAQKIIAALQKRGIPNYFGLQRFGHNFNSHILGQHLLTKETELFLAELLGPRPEPYPDPFTNARAAYQAGQLDDALKLWPKHQSAEYSALRSLIKVPDDKERAVRAIPKALRFFYGSALQSYLFNGYLSKVLKDSINPGLGSIAILEKNGAAFEIDDLSQEEARLKNLEIHPSGPLFGAKLLRPSEQSLERQIEDRVLNEATLELSNFENSDLKLSGMRRALRIPLHECQIDQPQEGCLELKFFLPKGCYATGLLQELFQRPIS